MIKHCTRLNGLTLKKQSQVESPTVTTYPSAEGRRVTRGCVCQERNMLIIIDQYKEKVNLATSHGQMLRDEQAKVSALRVEKEARK